LIQLAEVEAYLSDNLLGDATVTASSSTEAWGWSLRYATDVRREGIGWSSGEPSASRPEWIEFALPQARTMNRVDLYPRSDGGSAGNLFPHTFTVEAFRGGQWHTVVTQTDRPHPGAAPQRFTFAPQSAERLRIRTGAGRHVQFAEVEAHLSGNQLADAVVTAASNLENWGWSLRYANDGVSDGIGYSSADPHAADRREWIEFAFPGPRTLNQLELYPRADGANAGMSFPANFTVEAWRDGQWHTVLTRTDHPNPGAAPQRYLFPAQTAERLRITADAGRFLQLAEVAAHHI
jgi:hypothetical protein